MAEFGFRKRGKVEYLRVMYERYRQAERSTRTALLDEFCVATSYNRKYAIRPLNEPLPGKEQVRQPRGRKPRYGKQVMSVLTAVWQAAGYPWSVRLKALLPSWMPWIRQRFRLNQMLEQELLAMSAPDGPPTPESKTRTEAQDLWAYQTRCAVEAPYPGENGQLGFADAWLHPR